MKNIIKLSILFFAPIIAFAMDKEMPPATEESTCIFLPGDVVKHIFRFLPITELQVFLINRQWHTWAQETEAFKGYVNLCEKYQKNKAICLKEMPSVEQAVDMVHELRTLFAALPASQDEKAQLAENFENKHSLPVILFRPSKGQGKVSLAQAQKLQKAVQDHFFILAMMRIHREQIYPADDDIDYEVHDVPKQFTIDFTIHPMLIIIAPRPTLIEEFRSNDDDNKMAYAKALCDRGFYLPVLEEVQSSDDRAKKDLARILFERGQNLRSLDCILLANKLHYTDVYAAKAWYKKALAQGLDLEKISDVDFYCAGLTLLLNKDYKAATHYYEKALQWRPQGWDVHFILDGGNAYYYCNDFTKAASWYKRAIKTDIEQIDQYSWANAGFTFLNLKNFARAVQCYEKALQKQPRGWTPAFFLGLGSAYEHMNNVAQAAHYFKKWIDMMMQSHDKHQGRVNYPLIKDVLVKDRAPEKYVVWVGARINKSQQPVSNEALNNQ